MDGKHWTVIAQQLGWGEGGGVYAQWDDGNPTWEDMDDDPEDPETEARWRQDDINNGEIIPTFLENAYTDQEQATRKKGREVRLRPVGLLERLPETLLTTSELEDEESHFQKMAEEMVLGLEVSDAEDC